MFTGLIVARHIVAMSKHSHQAYRRPRGNGNVNHVNSIDFSLEQILHTSKTLSQHELSGENGSKSVIAPTLCALNSTEMSSIAQMEKFSNDLKDMGNKSKFSLLGRTDGKTHSLIDDFYLISASFVSICNHTAATQYSHMENRTDNSCIRFIELSMELLTKSAQKTPNTTALANGMF